MSLVGCKWWTESSFLKILSTILLYYPSVNSMIEGLGKFLNLEVGESHGTLHYTVVKLDGRTFLFKTSRLAFLEGPETTRSYIFFLEDFHKVIESLAKLIT